MQALGLIGATEPIFLPCLLAEQAAAGSDDCAVCQHPASLSEHQALILPQPLAFACLPPKQACGKGRGMQSWVRNGGRTTYILIFVYIFNFTHAVEHVKQARGRAQAAGCRGDTHMGGSPWPSRRPGRASGFCWAGLGQGSRSRHDS